MSTQNHIALAQYKTMSSLEISELTGKPHNDVLKDIRRVLAEAGIGEGKFSHTYFSSQNKELPCFNLPRRECDLVISGYSVKYRLAMLRAAGYLQANNQPYQRYIDSGYFVVIENTPFVDRDGNSHPSFTTRITGKGQVALEKKFRKSPKNGLVLLQGGAV
jgi:hypothetical protein